MLLQESMIRVAALALVGISVVAQQPTGTHQPSPEHKKLGGFVGTWKDEAEMKPSPLGPGGKMTLTEICDWVHRWFQHSVPYRNNGLYG